MFWEVRKGESTIGHLPEDQLKRLMFTVSPLIEQRKIVDYLTEETAAVGALISDKQTMIEKLHEYHRLLISEAVTGKFKVSDV